MTESDGTARDESAHVRKAIELLKRCSERPVSDCDIRTAQSLLVDQYYRLVNTGIARAEEAALVALDDATSAQEGVIDITPLNSDPVRAGFEVEQEETRIVLEILRTLRARFSGQQQEQTQKATLCVAIAAVAISAIIGIAQVIVTLLRT